LFIITRRHNNVLDTTGREISQEPDKSSWAKYTKPLFD